MTSQSTLTKLRARLVLYVAAVVGALFLAGCAVPFGPGYQIERQAVELHYAASAPDRFHVRATYRLKNVGNTALTALQAELPASTPYAYLNLRVSLDGREIHPQGAPLEAAAQGRETAAKSSLIALPLEPPWPQNSRHELVVECDFMLPYESAALDAFYRAADEWFPTLRPPAHTFARGAARAAEVDVRIRVPQGWHALSSGESRGTRKRNTETEYRFRLRKDDFEPFVIAGRYHEQKVVTANATLIFWTLQPAGRVPAEKAGARLAVAVRVFDRIFGPRDKKAVPLWLVEIRFPKDMTPVIAEAFPNGALLSGEHFQEDFGKEAFFNAANPMLVHTWTDEISKPLPEAADFSVVLGEYAVRLADEAWGVPFDRHKQARELLELFDSLRANEERDRESGRNPWRAERERSKNRLFLLALEDRLSGELLNRSLRRMIQALRGSTWGFADLRAAIEAESGQDLAEFFRVWLNQTGIPEDFRQRYAAGPSLPR